MNSEEIISGGLLEAYITGQLSDADKAAVESSLKIPEVRIAYVEIQSKLEFMAFKAALEPGANVRTNLLSKLILKGSNKARTTYLMAASISLAILSSAAAFYFYTKYTISNEQLAQLSQQNEALTNNIQQVNQQMTSMRTDLSILINPAFTRIVMNSTQEGIVQQAVIYHNPSERKVYLNSSTLPELPEDLQYQLWALIDGQPVDAGVFISSKDTFQQMNSFEQVDAFAVTIEPKGGSKSPTLEKMQVYGEG